MPIYTYEYACLICMPYMYLLRTGGVFSRESRGVSCGRVRGVLGVLAAVTQHLLACVYMCIYICICVLYTYVLYTYMYYIYIMYISAEHLVFLLLSLNTSSPIRIHTYICMYIRIYVCTYVCMYVHTYICMYIRMYVYTYVYMYAYGCICVYIYT